jgi:predicted HicB family RNase H-like nuclease
MDERDAARRRIEEASRATQINFVLRVPASLMEDLRVASERDGVSMNIFIVQAVAE